jgi:hypothetical protein
MNGYFSQLVGQTGIVLPQQNVRTQNTVSDIFSLESDAEEMPIQEEHLEVTVSQPEQPVSPADRVDREIRESDRLISSKTVSNPPGIPSQITSVPETVQPIHPPAMSETGEQNEREPNQQQTISEQLEQMEVQTFSESIPISKKLQLPEIKSSKDGETTSAIIADRPSKIAGTESIESVQVESKLAENESTKTTVNLPPNYREYWQAIREWVAGTTGEIEEIQEISAQETPASEQNVKPATAPSNRQPAAVPLAVESRQLEAQTPQEQDFVLAIGSINLTIAAPQPETLLPPVLPSQNSPKIESNFAASRLSRYYLRLR